MGVGVGVGVAVLGQVGNELLWQQLKEITVGVRGGEGGGGPGEGGGFFYI